jgi:hypothetical protein
VKATTVLCATLAGAGLISSALPAEAIHYTTVITLAGFPSEIETTALVERLGSTAGPGSSIDEFWRSCHHPLISPCGRPDAYRHWGATGLAVAWNKLAQSLVNKDAAGFSGESSGRDARLKGRFTLALDSHSMEGDAGVGYRMILAVSQGLATAPRAGLSASWSSKLTADDTDLPGGYESAAETFATVQLTRCGRGSKDCETEVLYEQGYPGDGEGGFELPASMLEVPQNRVAAVKVFFEQRLSAGPSAPLR